MKGEKREVWEGKEAHVTFWDRNHYYVERDVRMEGAWGWRVRRPHVFN
jgi:hypothetical protein